MGHVGLSWPGVCQESTSAQHRCSVNLGVTTRAPSQVQSQVKGEKQKIETEFLWPHWEERQR